VTTEIGEPIGSSGLFARLDDTFIRLDLEANRIQQAQLRSTLDYAQREAKRYQELARKGNASKQRLDELEQTYRDHQHRLDELVVRERILEQRLVRTKVTAEPGWLVTMRRVEPGQRVNEGDVLGEVGDFSTLLVPFALSPGQISALDRQRDDLTVTLPDLDLEVPVRIYRVNPGFDATTRKTALDLAIDADLPQHRGGLRAQLVLKLPEATGAVMLPEKAVEESYEEFWVTREDGERLRVVRLGNHSGPDGTWIRLTGPGIAPGDRFQLTGLE
jgi:multidrug efflux pump subunit AcrA (membrane-fusion protein)